MPSILRKFSNGYDEGADTREGIGARVAKVCIDKGYVVSAPLNDHGGYDFIIENGSHLKKIQVRATGSPLTNRKDCYKINCTSTKGFDFLAFYMRDIDTWYIIPKHVITCKTIIINPTMGVTSKSKFEHYRENWDIIFDI